MTNNKSAMTGKICMVTKATAGIVLVTARTLTQQVATVIGVGLNRA